LSLLFSSDGTDSDCSESREDARGWFREIDGGSCFCLFS